MGYRWQLLEGLVRASSSEHLHEIRGAILFADWVLGSAPYDEVRNILGISDKPPTPPPDYMRPEAPLEETP